MILCYLRHDSETGQPFLSKVNWITSGGQSELCCLLDQEVSWPTLSIRAHRDGRSNFAA